MGKKTKQKNEKLSEEVIEALVSLSQDNIERPNKVRVFGKEYVITYASSHLGMEDYGKTDFNSLHIIIQDFQLPFLEADTVLHEVVHTIDDIMDLKLSEHQVLTLTSGLMGVFQDNPEFANYIIKQRPTVKD